MTVNLKKSSKRRGRIKLYAKVLRFATSNSHNVVRIRTRGMKRWLCDCEDFLFRKAARSRHCDHIKEAKARAAQQLGIKEISL